MIIERRQIEKESKISNGFMIGARLYEIPHEHNGEYNGSDRNKFMYST